MRKDAAGEHVNLYGYTASRLNDGTFTPGKKNELAKELKKQSAGILELSGRHEETQAEVAQGQLLGRSRGTDARRRLGRFGDHLAVQAAQRSRQYEAGNVLGFSRNSTQAESQQIGTRPGIRRVG